MFTPQALPFPFISAPPHPERKHRLTYLLFNSRLHRVVQSLVASRMILHLRSAMVINVPGRHGSTQMSTLHFKGVSQGTGDLGGHAAEKGEDRTCAVAGKRHRPTESSLDTESTFLPTQDMRAIGHVESGSFNKVSLCVYGRRVWFVLSLTYSQLLGFY